MYQADAQQTCLKQTGVHCRQCAPQVATGWAHAVAIWLPRCQLVPLCQSISLCAIHEVLQSQVISFTWRIVLVKLFMCTSTEMIYVT